MRLQSEHWILVGRGDDCGVTTAIIMVTYAKNAGNFMEDLVTESSPSLKTPTTTKGIMQPLRILYWPLQKTAHLVQNRWTLSRECFPKRIISSVLRQHIKVKFSLVYQIALQKGKFVLWTSRHSITWRVMFHCSSSTACVRKGSQLELLTVHLWSGRNGFCCFVIIFDSLFHFMYPKFAL